VKKSTFTPTYDVLRAKLISLRKSAGLTQRQLAGRLRREHSFVARLEQGERRLDLVELIWVCEACGAVPEKVLPELLKEMRAVEGAKGRGPKSVL
jgi:transcriptional regulator with XRE-family HTH domain